MNLNITVLSENTASMGNFLAEWGLSVLIETGEMRILLDTGAGSAAVHNADALGLDLKTVDKIVLSHGHNDHTGGLREILKRMKKRVDVIAHPDVWQKKYHRRRDDPERFIGIPFQPEELESAGADFHLSNQPVLITENLLTTGEIPMVTDYETIDPGLFIREGQEFQPDQLKDDRAVIIKTGKGLVIILGCAHRGMINTVYHAQKITGMQEIYALIGGSHLIGASEERLWLSINALKELGVQKLGLCHCTDLPVISILSQEFGENYIFVKSGLRLDLT